VLVYCPGPASGSSRLDYVTHTREIFYVVKIGCQSFMDLDYVDDVALLAELLRILTRGLGVMSEEASLLGLQAKWARTKIQYVGDNDSVAQSVYVGSSQVEVVNENSHTSEHAPVATILVSPRSSGALVLSGIV